jgi:hypothetical protein
MKRKFARLSSDGQKRFGKRTVPAFGWIKPNGMTVAHQSLPFGTVVQITNKSNGKTALCDLQRFGGGFVES